MTSDHHMPLLINGSLAGYQQSSNSYENALKLYFGVEHSVMVPAQISVMHAAFTALGVKEGDQVIIPVTAAAASLLSIVQYGARPVLIDCKADSFEIDITQLDRVVTDRTKAIVSVPVLGYPTTTEELRKFCQSRKIPLIVDASQALGAQIDNLKEGANADIGIFALNDNISKTSRGHHFILTKSAKLAEAVRRITGSNNPLETQQLGIAELTSVPAQIQKRRDKARTWLEILAPFQDYLSPLMLESPSRKPTFTSMVFVMNDDRYGSISNKRISEELLRVGFKSEETDNGNKSINSNPFSSITEDEKFPYARSLLDKIVILPTHEHLTRERIIRAGEIIISLFDGKHSRSDLWLPHSQSRFTL